MSYIAALIVCVTMKNILIYSTINITSLNYLQAIVTALRKDDIHYCIKLNLEFIILIKS